MTRNRPINLDGRRCECGALTENGSPTCRKCRSRARWLRRKNWRHQDAFCDRSKVPGLRNAKRR
jgi:hypothetical protein